MEEKKKKLTGQQGELMRALDITIDDLLANDEGYITGNQQETVLKRQSYQWRQYKVLAVVFPLFALLFAGIAFSGIDELIPLLLFSLAFLVPGILFWCLCPLSERQAQK